MGLSMIRPYRIATQSRFIGCRFRNVSAFNIAIAEPQIQQSGHYNREGSVIAAFPVHVESGTDQSRGNRMTFAEQMQQAIEQTVVKQIRDGKGVGIPYGAVEVPPSFIRECWELVDQENLKKEIAKILEKELAQRIVNKFESEVANDIKQVLSDKEQRENVRAYIRKNISTLIGE
jgi:hypothetical protein